MARLLKVGLDKRTDFIPVERTVMTVFGRAKQALQARVTNEVNAHDMLGCVGDVTVMAW